MDGPEPRTTSSTRVLTLPNVISAARIALIPVFWKLIVDEDTTPWGIVLFGAVVSTDWVDGFIARRTGQVSNVGKVLDPVADRAAIASGLVALVIRGAFPSWAAVLILARDAVLLVGGLLLLSRGVRLDVRWIGKVATFALMIAIPAVAWGSLDLWLAPVALAIGWPTLVVGLLDYYVAAAAYVVDARRALEPS
jgi:cardiolipin synthase (CMP-forming)